MIREPYSLHPHDNRNRAGYGTVSRYYPAFRVVIYLHASEYVRPFQLL